jgi:hypothetical protein
VSFHAEFVISVSDLRKAMGQLRANRRQYKDSDFADILVSGFAATFRSVGTEAEVPVDGKRPGSVRIPLRILDRITQTVPTLKKRSLHFQCEPGVIKIGTWSVKHPDIEVGKIPDQRVGIPIDVSIIDTLAIAEILGPERIAEEGMRSRVEDAMDTRRSAISVALGALEPFGITKAQLEDLVDTQIGGAVKRLRKSLPSG